MNSYWIYLFFNAHFSHSSLFWRLFTNIALKLLMSDAFVKGKLHKWAKLERKFPSKRRVDAIPPDKWTPTLEKTHCTWNTLTLRVARSGHTSRYRLISQVSYEGLMGYCTTKPSEQVNFPQSQWTRGERMRREGRWLWPYGPALTQKWLNGFYTQDYLFFPEWLVINILRAWTSVSPFPQQSPISISNLRDQLAGFLNLYCFVGQHILVIFL